MKVSTAASKVIALAEAIRDYWAEELPRRHPNYPLMGPGEDSGPPPPEEKKLRQLLARLPEDTLYKLALVAYLGRVEFDTRDLAGDFQALRENFPDADALISQMMEKAPLADYLSEGLEQLKSHGIDIDETLPKVVQPQG